jgi:hypothetical protein
MDSELMVKNDLLLEAYRNMKIHLRKDNFIVETNFTPIGISTKYLAMNVSNDTTMVKVKEMIMEQIEYTLFRL